MKLSVEGHIKCMHVCEVHSHHDVLLMWNLFYCPGELILSREIWLNTVICLTILFHLSGILSNRQTVLALLCIHASVTMPHNSLGINCCIDLLWSKWLVRSLQELLLDICRLYGGLLFNIRSKKIWKLSLQWLALLLHIREVPNLSTGPPIGYPNRGFFLSSSFVGHFSSSTSKCIRCSEKWPRNRPSWDISCGNSDHSDPCWLKWYSGMFLSPFSSVFSC